MQLRTKSNVAERVSVEDYLAMRERAERAEQNHWLMQQVPVAASYRAARRAIERLVAEAIARTGKRP